jgi:hypothetical protein
MSLILSGTDGLSDVDGSAATPAIRGTDANTGIFFGADTIGFSEGGVEAMRLDSSGDVNLYNAKSFKVYNPANTRFGSLFTDGNGTNLASHNGSGEPILLNSPTGYIALSTNGSERSRILSDGKFLIGKTASNITTAGWGFAVTGSGDCTFTQVGTNEIFVWNNTVTNGTPIIDFRTNSISKGNINWNNTSTTYATVSDYRLKNTIAPMTGALAKVALLKPCVYKWNVDGSDGQGFIAHELQAVVPQCVTGEKDSVDADGNAKYQGIDTSFLIATLTAAIQEQQAIIESLKARLDAANL